MKKISFLLISLCILPIYADNSCKTVFDEALKVFHTGQYYDAKLMFEDISNECGKNYKNIDYKIFEEAELLGLQKLFTKNLSKLVKII